MKPCGVDHFGTHSKGNKIPCQQVQFQAPGNLTQNFDTLSELFNAIIYTCKIDNRLYTHSYIQSVSSFSSDRWEQDQ